MIIFFKTLFYFYFLIIFTVAYDQKQPFNISHYIPPFSTELNLPPPFLQDVLRAVSLSQGWNRSHEVQVSELDTSTASIGSSKKYDFGLGSEETQLIFRMTDEVSQWKNMVVEKGRDFESTVKETGLEAVISDFQIEGPVELLMRGDHELSLQLPGNTSYAGLTRILVGDGIALEVRNAQEVSLIFPLKLGKKDSHRQKKGGYLRPFQQSSCESLLPVHISGSATVAAYRDRNPDSLIQTKFRSRNTIELLPEKCYIGNNYKKQHYRIESLSSKIDLMEKLIESIPGRKFNNNRTFGYLKATIRASNIVRFRIELERKIRKEEHMLGEWRTRPTVERVWFKVVARIEGDRLKPVIIKKIIPFVEADSSSWSNILSNISFTNFPSFLVPQEDLTLDVKW